MDSLFLFRMNSVNLKYKYFVTLYMLLPSLLFNLMHPCSINVLISLKKEVYIQTNMLILGEEIHLLMGKVNMKRHLQPILLP